MGVHGAKTQPQDQVGSQESVPVLGEEGGWRDCGQRQGRWSPSWGWPPRARPGQGLLAQVRWTLPGPSHQWWDNRPGEGDSWGENRVGGEPLHRVPRIQTLSLGRRMLPGALEGTGETRSPGVAAKPRVRSQANAAEGRSARHMENPVSPMLPAAGSGSRPATACVPCLPCSLRGLPGT